MVTWLGLLLGVGVSGGGVGVSGWVSRRGCGTGRRGEVGISTVRYGG